MVILKRGLLKSTFITQRGSHKGFIVFYNPFFSPPLHNHRTKIWSVLVCKGGKWAEQPLYLIPSWCMNLVQRGEFLKIEGIEWKPEINREKRLFHK